MPRTRDQEKGSTPNTMSTLSDLEEVKAALDKGLVSQAEYDDVKRDYLRAKKKALEAKEEALVDFQKKELLAKEEFLRRELLAKEALQKRESEARLRTSALDAIVKHGSSIMSEEQKVDLVRDYVKMSGLDRDTERAGPSSKRQRTSAEPRDAPPPQPSTPPKRPPAPAALPPPPVAKVQVQVDKKLKNFNLKGFKSYLENMNALSAAWIQAALVLVQKSKAKTKRLFEEAAGRGYLGIFTDHRPRGVQGAVGCGDLLRCSRWRAPPCAQVLA